MGKLGHKYEFDLTTGEIVRGIGETLYDALGSLSRKHIHHVGIVSVRKLKNGSSAKSHEIAFERFIMESTCACCKSPGPLVPCRCVCMQVEEMLCSAS